MYQRWFMCYARVENILGLQYAFLFLPLALKATLLVYMVPYKSFTVQSHNRYSPKIWSEFIPNNQWTCFYGKQSTILNTLLGYNRILY